MIYRFKFLIVFSLIAFLVMPKFADAKYLCASLLMDSSKTKMESEKVNLVIFPHWVHNLWFKCKACHQNPFAMENGKTGVTMSEIENGEKCGKCHNGEISFAKDKCSRCHSFSTDEELVTLRADARTKKLYSSVCSKKLILDQDDENKNIIFKDPFNLPIDEVIKISNRLKVSIDEEYLREKGLPKGKIYVDFEKLIIDDKAIKPLSFIGEQKKDTIRDNVIVFEVLSSFVDNVTFSHAAHSSLINCDSCHEKVFKSKLGGNKTHMRTISKGKFCGHCHNKAAFPLSNCIKCHKLPHGEKLKTKSDVLFRKNPLKGKEMNVTKEGLKILE